MFSGLENLSGVVYSDDFVLGGVQEVAFELCDGAGLAAGFEVVEEALVDAEGAAGEGDFGHAAKVSGSRLLIEEGGLT